MKLTRLNIKTKTDNYPIIIGSNLTSSVSKIFKLNLIDLINKRSNIYSKALYEIKCDNLTKIEIVKKIVEIYETN